MVCRFCYHFIVADCLFDIAMNIKFTIGFTETPSPLNMTVEQGVATFHCQHRSCDDISWKVNGTLLSLQSVIKRPLSGGGFSSSLSIETHPDFNETTIQCVAIFFRILSPFQYTAPETLLIQGVM